MATIIRLAGTLRTPRVALVSMLLHHQWYHRLLHHHPALPGALTVMGTGMMLAMELLEVAVVHLGLRDLLK